MINYNPGLHHGIILKEVKNCIEQGIDIDMPIIPKATIVSIIAQGNTYVMDKAVYYSIHLEALELIINKKAREVSEAHCIDYESAKQYLRQMYFYSTGEQINNKESHP